MPWSSCASRRRRIGTGCCRSASSRWRRPAPCCMCRVTRLDEATASLDEPAEAALYHLLEQRLAGTTIVSIGHRSTLAAFHRRRLFCLQRRRRPLLAARSEPHAGGNDRATVAPGSDGTGKMQRRRSQEPPPVAAEGHMIRTLSAVAYLSAESEVSNRASRRTCCRRSWCRRRPNPFGSPGLKPTR